jgi:hypothetical protein
VSNYLDTIIAQKDLKGRILLTGFQYVPQFPQICALEPLRYTKEGLMECQFKNSTGFSAYFDDTVFKPLKMLIFQMKNLDKKKNLKLAKETNYYSPLLEVNANAEAAKFLVHAIQKLPRSKSTKSQMIKVARKTLYFH